MTNANQITSPAGSRRHWQAHVQTQQKSGLSRAEYCRQHNLSYHALTYWCRKTASIIKPSAHNSTLVPVPLSLAQPQQPERRNTSGLRLHIADNITIEVDTNFSPTTLHTVLSVLEQRQ